jgi:hypothetical protein
MFKGAGMSSGKTVLVLVCGLFLMGQACSANEALAQAQTVPVGERIANYLQSMMISVSAILEAKKQGDIISNPEIYRVGVTYDPTDKVIELSVVGLQTDPKMVQEKLELTRNLVMSFNKKIERNYGVTLGERDFVMDYLYAKTNQIILKYRDGQFLSQVKVEEVPTTGYVGSLEH